MMINVILFARLQVNSLDTARHLNHDYLFNCSIMLVGVGSHQLLRAGDQILGNSLLIHQSVQMALDTLVSIE